MRGALADAARAGRRIGERDRERLEPEDLGLLLREFLVGEDALLVQLAELGESLRCPLGRDPGRLPARRAARRAAGGGAIDCWPSS